MSLYFEWQLMRRNLNGTLTYAESSSGRCVGLTHFVHFEDPRGSVMPFATPDFAVLHASISRKPVAIAARATTAMASEVETKPSRTISPARHAAQNAAVLRSPGRAP